MAKSMMSEVNSALLPGNVDRQPRYSDRGLMNFQLPNFHLGNYTEILGKQN